METVMERLWTALSTISHDFDYPPDPESLAALQDSLAQVGLAIVELNQPACYSAGILSQMG